jgi:hypothetical protein
MLLLPNRARLDPSLAHLSRVPSQPLRMHYKIRLSSVFRAERL